MRIGNRDRKQRSSRIILMLVMLLALQLALGGCGGTGTAEKGSGDQGLVIATSFYPVYIMTRNIAADVPGVEVENITGTVTGCLHDYHLTTSDLKRLHRADILVINGGGMETFIDQAVEQRPGLEVVDAGRGLTLIKDEHGHANAHVWVSVSLAIKQVQNIADRLEELDAANGPLYRENARRYIKQLEELREEIREQMEKLPRRDIITFHEAFPYFAEEFGLNIVAVVEREPGAEPSALELAETIRIVEKSGVKAIFVEPQYSTKAADTIARETGCRVCILDPGATGPDDPEAYLKIMRQNLQVLTEALQD